MNTVDLRMNTFPQKLQFVFKHFTTVFLPVLPTHFMHRWSTWSTVVRCLQIHPHFRGRSLYMSKHFCFVGAVLLYLSERKKLILIQTWRIVKWFRYPFYDIGFYPCNDGIGMFITYLLCRFVNRRQVNNSKKVSERTWIWIWLVNWRHIRMTIIHQE